MLSFHRITVSIPHVINFSLFLHKQTKTSVTFMTPLQKGQQYFQVEEITPKNRVF